MATKYSFFCPGEPRPGGSKRAFVNPKTHRAVIVEDCKTSKDWRATVAMCASENIKDPIMGAVSMKIAFTFLRPKGHFGTNGLLRKSAPMFKTTKPDATKLTRSTEDAMKGIAWRDDSQVVDQHVGKYYGEQAGAWITIEEME